MKVNNNCSLLVALLFCIISQAQTKKWTLQECVKYAIEHNISIKQSDLDTKTAAIDRAVAVGTMMPSVNSNASHSWNIGLNQDITTGILRNQTTQFTSAGVSVGIDIYKGLQNQNILRRANLSILAAQYQLTKMKEDIALNVANAYLQVLFNKENLKVQQTQKSFNEKQLLRSQELVNAGSIPRGDLLDVKATVATNSQNLINAENALMISKLSLAQLLQLNNFYDFDVADNTTETENTNIFLLTTEVVFNKAKEQRTELKIAQTNLAIAEKNVVIAKGGYQPTLQGFYSFNTRASYSDVVKGAVVNSANPTSVIGFVDGTNQKVLEPNLLPITGSAPSVIDQFIDNKGQSFGVQLSIPIFNGFAAKNNVERSKVNLQKSKIAAEQEELTLQRNVYTAFFDAKGGLNTHQAALSALDARQEAFKYAKERYEVGMMNSFDFNQAQTLLSNAQSEVIRTKYDYIFRVKILEFYFGIPIIAD